MVILILGFSVSAGFLGGWFGATSRFNNLSQSQQQQVVSSESELISQIAKDVGPSVVSINVVSQNNRTDYFGRSIGEETSAGTGFIISTDGIVVTNRHVVAAEDSKVSIVLDDGTLLDDVTVIGRTGESDPLDVAFLKINDAKGKKLKAVKLGDSSQMEVGDKVVAIGNALGRLQNTVTSGIISGYGRDVQAGSSRSLESLQNLFQTDAAINQGNSGGPLVNMNSEVIGINTAVAGDAQNIGFAIPIDDVKGLIEGVLATGKFERAFLGVRYVSITEDYAEQYDLPAKQGAYVVPSSDGQVSIVPDSPAAHAGIREGDIITKINDIPIDEDNNLTSVLGRFKVGQKVTITLLHDGKEQHVDVMLTAAPQN